MNRDAAEQSLHAGRLKLAQGDVDGALRMATKSVELCETEEALDLQKQIQVAITQGNLVKRVLDAPSLFEVLGVGHAVVASDAKKA